MRISTPKSLSWLLRKKAYLLAEQEEQERKRADFLNKSDRVLEALRNDLAAIDTMMSMHEVRVDPNLVGPRKPRFKQHFRPHGSLIKNIVKVLLDSNGGPLTTNEILSRVVVMYDPPVPEEQQRALRQSVRYALKDMCSDGRMERVHAPQIKSALGIWRLPAGRIPHEETSS